MVMSEYIFHRNGLPIASFRKAWAKACKLAGVTGKLVHDLRRCAAKNLVEAGVPIPVAMKITGHKTISMFQRYAIIEPKQQREALRQTELYRAEQLAKLQQGQEAHA
jgi:integrase